MRGYLDRIESHDLQVIGAKLDKIHDALQETNNILRRIETGRTRLFVGRIVARYRRWKINHEIQRSGSNPAPLDD